MFLLNWYFRFNEVIPTERLVLWSGWNAAIRGRFGWPATLMQQKIVGWNRANCIIITATGLWQFSYWNLMGKEEHFCSFNGSEAVIRGKNWILRDFFQCYYIQVGYRHACWIPQNSQLGWAWQFIFTKSNSNQIPIKLKKLLNLAKI